MTQFENYHIIFLDKSNEVLSNEEIKDARDQTEVLKFTRGHFLDLIIEVEMIIEGIIADYMLHKRSNLRSVFIKNIINKKNLKQKIDLLCDIIIKKNALINPELGTLKKCLDFIRVERNKWAHGNIYFKQEENEGERLLQSYLRSINFEGNEKETKLTNDYFDELTSRFQTNQKSLVKILVKRKILGKEYLNKK